MQTWARLSYIDKRFLKIKIFEYQSRIDSRSPQPSNLAYVLTDFEDLMKSAITDHAKFPNKHSRKFQLFKSASLFQFGD